MQVAIVMTQRADYRAEIEGWTYEDSALYVAPTIDRSHASLIGLTPSPRIKCYRSVLEMLADGWEPLAPPVPEAWAGTEGFVYNWWLTRRTA